MPKEIQIKMAMPRPEECEAVWAFLRGIEAIMEGWIPDGDLAQYSAGNITDDATLEWIGEAWEKMQQKASWERVLMAGETAIDNACDRTQPTLEWKPEIEEALVKWAEVRHHFDFPQEKGE
jgi:hypothetical protein